MLGKIQQSIFGFFNKQKVVNNFNVVDEKYLQDLLSFGDNPSDLNEVMLALYDSFNDNKDGFEKRAIPPDIEVKINHNNVCVYKDSIEILFSESGFFLDMAYESLDNEAPGRKKTFLSSINMLYKNVLLSFMKQNPGMPLLEVVRLYADSIINELITKLLLRLASNKNLVKHITRESIERNVLIIVCHAFVDCKVLENPNRK